MELNDTAGHAVLVIIDAVEIFSHPVPFDLDLFSCLVLFDARGIKNFKILRVIFMGRILCNFNVAVSGLFINFVLLRGMASSFSVLRLESYFTVLLEFGFETHAV